MADKSRMSAALRPIDLDKMRKKFRVRKAGACIAIDLDGSTLRAVQTAPRGDGFFVSRIIAEPLGLPADSDRNDPVVIGRAISSTVDRAGVGGAPEVASLPPRPGLLPTLSLPGVREQREMQSRADFQIARDHRV